MRRSRCPAARPGQLAREQVTVVLQELGGQYLVGVPALAQIGQLLGHVRVVILARRIQQEQRRHVAGETLCVMPRVQAAE
jgi:hypothetical protein